MFYNIYASEEVNELRSVVTIVRVNASLEYFRVDTAS